MRALNEKLYRDLIKMWDLVIVIALMIAGGVATFVAMRSTLRSLQQTRDGRHQSIRVQQSFATIPRSEIDTPRRANRACAQA